MQIFTVGGAVRDYFLNVPARDRDYVVIGATIADMLDRGYHQVGNGFPVFLHPKTREEYALARQERQVGQGYNGFAFDTADVTLEQDLFRRDFTINAMAQALDGTIVDPFNGQQDLAAGIIRHVSDAFAESPERVIRAAYFAARFGFRIDPRTAEICRDMVANGRMAEIVLDLQFKLLSKGLMTDRPGRFIQILRDLGALKALLPEVDALFGVPQPEQHHPEVDTGIHVCLCLDRAARFGYSLLIRFGVLCHDLGKALTPPDLLPKHHGHEDRGVDLARNLTRRIHATAEIVTLAQIAAAKHTHVHRAPQMNARSLVNFIKEIDALRRPHFLTDLIKIAECDAKGRPGFEDCDYPGSEILIQTFWAMKAVDQGAIAGSCTNKAQIPARIHQEFVRAVRAVKLSQREGS